MEGATEGEEAEEDPATIGGINHVTQSPNDRLCLLDPYMVPLKAMSTSYYVPFTCLGELIGPPRRHYDVTPTLCCQVAV